MNSRNHSSSSRKQTRRWWTVYGIGCALCFAALIWMTSAVFGIENREKDSRIEAARQEAVRLALWRMDSWISPRLATEAARPYYEYLSYYPPERAYTQMLNEIEPGSVVSPSPLLAANDNTFVLYFQIDDQGHFSSPQVPSGNYRDLAEGSLVSAGCVDAATLRLMNLETTFTANRIRNQLAARIAQTRAASLAQSGGQQQQLQTNDDQQLATQTFQSDGDLDLPTQQQQGVMQQQRQLSQAELDQRAKTNSVSQSWSSNSANPPFQAPQTDVPKNSVGKGGTGKGSTSSKGSNLKIGDLNVPSSAELEIGPLTGLWLTPDDNEETKSDGPMLVFAREIRIHTGGAWLQGFEVNWDKLKADLLAQITDLFTDAGLTPSLPGAGTNNLTQAQSMMSLASVPVTMNIDHAQINPTLIADQSAGFSVAKESVIVAWIVVIASLIAGAVSIKASSEYGERRSRFASAVTHELRTPLTTFQLYSEMLADNMITDETKRNSYLQTLKTESSRLARLVENVLSYARVEDGRQATRLESVPCADLLANIEPELRHRTDEAGMMLNIDCDSNSLSGSTTRIDRDAIDRIITNLVDNACKYATGDALPKKQIDLAIHCADGKCLVTIRDYGLGIPPDDRKRIFDPFARGSAEAHVALPGIGLGLALCRALARDLGGDLSVQTPPQTTDAPAAAAGAQFVLSLPAFMST